MRRRAARRPARSSARTSCPSNRTVPDLGSTSRRIERPVVDLPQPLSPTSASVSPACSENETSSTACTRALTRPSRPERMSNRVTRLRDFEHRALGHRRGRRGVGHDSRRSPVTGSTIGKALRVGPALHRAQARHRGEQRARVRLARRREELRGGRLLDRVAVQHDDRAVGDLGHHAHVVRDERDRHAFLVLQQLDQLEDLGLDRDVERGGRLVGDQELRLARERHGDHHALAHAAGEPVRILVQPRSPRTECARAPGCAASRLPPARDRGARW